MWERFSPTHIVHIIISYLIPFRFHTQEKLTHLLRVNVVHSDNAMLMTIFTFTTNISDY